MHPFQTGEQSVHRLLSTEQSTTYMLEEMLNTRLSVQVTFQERVPGTTVSAHVRDWLGITDEETVIVRKSGLYTPDNLRVSQNYVVIKITSDQKLLTSLTACELPIIRILQQSKEDYPRRLLGYGRGNFEIDGEELFACYKHYLVSRGSAPLMYIHEVFHPGWIDPS
jgi:chorismate-pyruvate lyase